MACDHRLIQKQWMLGQVGYEDSCPECDRKRIAELEKALQTAIEELESETCSACNDLRTVLKPKENE